MSTLRLLFCTLALGLLPAPRAHAVPGDVDPLDASIGAGSFNSVLASVVQPDGKTIIAGQFTHVLGVPRSNIARLNVDGTLDTGFHPNANVQVNCVAVQADGKVLLGGFFTTLQPDVRLAPIPRRYIARLNGDGTLDTGFDPKAGDSVFSVAVQADGKVVLGGLFTSLQPNGAASPTPRNRIARVHADGTLDTGFNPNTNDFVWSLAMQADGKVLLGGDFTALQPNGAAAGIPRQCIARVNADGTLDTGFDPKAGDSVFCVAVQADGKVLLGGQFTTLQPNGAASATTRNNIARVNADGTLDTGFNPNANDAVRSVALQADGKILLGGHFTTLQPNGAAAPTTRRSIARVTVNGALDTGFDPNASGGPFPGVYSVAVQADGRVFIGGGFTMLQPNGAASPTERPHFARLLNDPAIQTLSMPSATQVFWSRSGAGPEVLQVAFELSTNGGTTWTPLGSGPRVGTSPNWQLTNLSLPASGTLRARGRTAGGYLNGSSGLIEQVFSYSPTDTDGDGLLDAWELTYWPTTAGHSAGDDFDRDGLTELEELAFGLNPTLPDAALQPAVVAEGGYLTVTLTKHAGAAYEVQSAGTLLDTFTPATTTVLLDTATTLKVRDNILIGTPPARFLRVKVTAAP